MKSEFVLKKGARFATAKVTVYRSARSLVIAGSDEQVAHPFAGKASHNKSDPGSGWCALVHLTSPGFWAPVSPLHPHQRPSSRGF